MEKSIDKATLSVLKEAEKSGIKTAWDRYQAQQPQCGGLAGFSRELLQCWARPTLHRGASSVSCRTSPVAGVGATGYDLNNVRAVFATIYPVGGNRGPLALAFTGCSSLSSS